MQVIQTLLCFSNIMNGHIRHFLEGRLQAITDSEYLDQNIHGYAIVVDCSSHSRPTTLSVDLAKHQPPTRRFFVGCDFNDAVLFKTGINCSKW